MKLPCEPESSEIAVPTWCRCILWTLVSTLGVLLVNWLMQVTLYGIVRWSTVVLHAVLAASLSGSLLYQHRLRQLLLLQQQEHQDRLLQYRMRLIADCNHHVRNALHVISLSTYGKMCNHTGRTCGAELLGDQVDRIRWVLEALLPQVANPGGQQLGVTKEREEWDKPAPNPASTERLDPACDAPLTRGAR